MSIDSGQSITFNANFPVPNVDQSSQQFRDNFLITKTAIENLQTASTTNASVLTITTSLSGPVVQFSVGFKDGGFALPSGNPGTPTTGMIRYNAGGIEFYSAGVWNPVTYKDGTTGVTNITTLSVSTKATVPVAAAPTDAVQYSQLQAETNARVAADSQLSTDISNVAANAVTSADLDAVANGVGMFGAQIANASADAANALSIANFTANALTQEIADRIANDALIRSDFGYEISNTSITDHGGASNVYTIANNVVGLSALLANVGGTDANAVQKTGDTMSGPLTMSANLDITNSNVLFIGGSDTEIFYQDVACATVYGSTNFLVKSHLRTTAIESTGHIYLNPTGGSNLYVGDASSQRLTLDSSGNLTASGDITAFSDITLKYDIKTIPNALSKVLAMRGTSFKRADLAGNPSQIGVIAQEMMGIVPEVVREGDNGLYSVAYGNLVAVLIEAIKELSAEVTALKARTS